MLDPTLKVPRVRTQLPWAEVLRVIAACAPELSAAALRKAVAQAQFETADFGCCWNFNWGNVRPSKGEAYYTCRASEYDENGVLVWLPDSPFQAYTSHEEGCKDWVKVLRSFPAAWEVLVDDSKSAYDFAYALSIPVKGRGKYYTDKPEHYAKCVEQMWRTLWLTERGLKLIKANSRGSVVTKWQRLIGAAETGVFDPPTIIATRKWQLANGVRPADAIVGFFTWREALEGEADE